MQADEHKAVFARKASGLVRTLSPLDMIIYAAGFAGIPFMALTTVWMFAWQPGGQQGIATVITCGLFVFVALVFAWFMIAMPRAGADYLFVSRSVHPALGFVSSWSYTVGVAFWAGFIAYYAGTIGVPMLLVTLGISLRDVGLINLAAMIGSPPWTTYLPLILAIPFLWGLSMGLLLMPVKRMFLWIRFWWWVQILGTALALGILLLTPQSVFVSNYNSLINTMYPGQGGFDSVISTAIAKGFNPNPGISWAGTIAIIPLYGVVFNSCFAPVITAGEVKSIKKSAYFGILGSLPVLGVISALYYYATLSAVGQDFAASISYLANFSPSSLPISISPQVYLLATIANPNVITAFIMGLAFLAMCLWVAPLNPIYGTRAFFAWSLDKMLPQWMADTNRWHTPKWTPIPMMALSTFFLVLFVFWPTVLQMFTFISVGWMFMFVCLAGALFPFVKKTVFEASPVKWRVGGIPVISIAGAIGFLFLATLFGLYGFNPAYGGGGSIIWVAQAIVLGSGVITFYGIKAYRMRHGVDVMLAYREIPPV